MRGKVVAWVTVSTLIVGAAGYAAADAADLVPGILTSEPLPSPQPPLLTASPITVAEPSSGPVGLVSGDAPVPSPDAVQALAEQLRADSRTGKSTNVLVVDYLTGQVLASVDGDDPQVPASTTKLLTAVAALQALGPDYRFTTRVVQSGSTLTLVAGGDLMLRAGKGHGGAELDADGRVLPNGFAGMADLGEQIEAAVPVGPITLAVDTTDFPGPSYPASWPAYALSMGYAGRVEGIAINIGKKNGVDVGEYGARDKEPAVRALDTLAKDLTKRGYEVTVVGKRAAASGSEEVASVVSAPLWAVVTEFLRYSDNTVTEQVARVLGLEKHGAATPENAARATREVLEEMGVSVDGLVLYDGAGYSDRNQISPRTLVDSMVRSAEFDNTNDLLTYLPLGGLEGTVGKRFAGAPAAGYLRAKTGSLTGVTTLAGVVTTADGRLLAFATLLDGMPPGQPRPMAAVNDFVNGLAECGCG